MIGTDDAPVAGSVAGDGPVVGGAVGPGSGVVEVAPLGAVVVGSGAMVVVVDVVVVVVVVGGGTRQSSTVNDVEAVSDGSSASTTDTE